MSTFALLMTDSGGLGFSCFSRLGPSPCFSQTTVPRQITVESTSLTDADVGIVISLQRCESRSNCSLQEVKWLFVEQLIIIKYQDRKYNIGTCWDTTAAANKCGRTALEKLVQQHHRCRNKTKKVYLTSEPTVLPPCPPGVSSVA